MIRQLTLILAIFAFSITFGEELPPAPEGYTWKRILDDKSALLIPDGWHFKMQNGKNTDGFFVSKEDIDKSGKFDTGLSLNVIRKIKKATKLTPSQYSAAMINQAEKSKKVLLFDSRDAGPFKALTQRYLDEKPGLPNVIVHNLFIANDETNTLWFYIFEAPESDWEESWKIGDTILSHLLLETEI